MRDEVQRAVSAAQVQGATYAEARTVERLVQSVAVRDGRVETASSTESAGLGVRVLVDGAWGFAATADLRPAAVEAAASSAVAIGRASARVRGQKVELGEPVRSQGTYRTPVEIDPFSVSLEEKVALLLRADEAIRRVAGVTVSQAAMVAQRERKHFATSEGALLEQEIVETGCGMSATAVGQGERQTRSYPGSQGRNQQCRGYEMVVEADLPSQGQRVGEEAVALLTAKQCPSGVTTIILDASQVALQVHESCGHPIELDRVFGTEMDFAGGSFLSLDQLGQLRYGSELITIYADATIPGGLGTFGWDDEGVEAQRAPIVKEGLFVGYLTSRETAARLGRRSMGAARADGWNRMPLVRMTNVGLEPGTWTLEDMIANTDDGIYMETNRSWSIDEVRLNFQFGTEIAYEIKGGKRGALLKNATYTGITPRFWNSCDAVGDRDHWAVYGTPNCGKGQPMQVAHTGHPAAPARFRNIQVGVIR